MYYHQVECFTINGCTPGGLAKWLRFLSYFGKDKMVLIRFDNKNWKKKPPDMGTFVLVRQKYVNAMLW